MRKLFNARGISAAVAFASAIGLVGCGADGFDEGAAGEGEIGSTEQALSTLDSTIFPGSIKLDATHSLVLGGYDSTGAGVTLAGIYTSTGGGAWDHLRNAADSADVVLPLGLGEPQIIAVPGQTNVFLMVGGRTAREGAASANSYLVTLNLSGVLKRASIVATTGAMATGRAGFGLAKCGSSKIIALGGATNKSMEDLANAAATNTIEVYDPSAGTWSPLKDTNTPVADTITLSEARAYPATLSFNSDLDFVIAGGINSGGSVRLTTDRLTVNSSCVASTNLNPNTTVAGNSLPGRLAQSAFIKLPSAATVSATSYEQIVVGGIDNSANNPVSSAAYLYDEGADGWIATGSITTARAFPLITVDGSNVTLLSGVIDNGSGVLFQTSSKAKQTYTVSSATWATAGSHTNERVGAFIHDATHVGFGGKYVSGALNMLTDIE